MVKRLTYRPEAPYTNGKGERVEAYSDYTAREIINRLAAYEDLGPVEEFEALKERTRWVAVSERLPEKDGFYNVVMNGDRWGEPDVWSATSCGFYDGMWDEDGTTITHWMLLPEAPKEAGKEQNDGK